MSNLNDLFAVIIMCLKAAQMFNQEGFSKLERLGEVIRTFDMGYLDMTLLLPFIIWTL